MKALLALGANLGDREEHLRLALRSMVERGCQVIAKSAVYETDSVGFGPAPRYLNAVIEVEGQPDPWSWLALAKAIEAELGRAVRGRRNAPRTIDIDLLACLHTTVLSRELSVPHPRMSGRAFVMVPLADLEPDPAYFPAGVPTRSTIELPPYPLLDW